MLLDGSGLYHRGCTQDISLALPMFSSGVTFLPSHVLGVLSPQSLSSVPCCCDKSRPKGTRGRKFILVYVPEGKPMEAEGQGRKQQAGRQEQKAERPYLNLKQEAEGELEVA